MIAGFIDGFTAYFKAFGIISRYRLWSYMVIPAVLAVVLAVLIFRFAWGISDDLGGWLISFYPFDWGRTWLVKVANVFSGLMIIAFSILFFKNLILAIASPFMSFLSENVEKQIKGLPEVPFSLSKMGSDFLRGITIAFRNIIRELFFTLIILLIGLIPPFGLLAPIAIFLVQAYYAGFGNLDFTLERHFRVGESVRFVRKNKGLALGNGTAFLLLFFTGIGFVFALPLGAVAGTTEVLKRLE
ncbi:MAG: hypothetical protein DHS20C18_27630 [Saprospiraceae bacterium]|nr:MAG: hypothetical protein DHS20C18_27630 [Saprospiraceae bacterium]